MKDLYDATMQNKPLSPNNKNTLNSHHSNSTLNIRKKKEFNEYYIGNENSIKNNNSTLIDQNEFFLNVLESQQLLVNSGLNRIENEEIEENGTEDSESKNGTENTGNTKDNKKSENSSKITNNNINTNTLEDLKQKIDKTLHRAKNIFNKDNSNKKDKNKNIQNDNQNVNIYTHSKAHEIKIESSNADKDKNNNKNKNTTSKQTSSAFNTKEKNLPSLSHNYSTNSDPNKKIKIDIEPRAVLNLIEVLKFIIQRKVFVMLYESYINKAIFQQYNIAFAYFIAICKQYPYRKIEEYCNFKTYNYAFLQLFKPIIKKRFKYFIHCCYTKRKVEYLSILLTKMFKFKVMERIFIASQFSEGTE